MTTIDEYRRLFTDASYWAPFVKAVCNKHGLGTVHKIEAGNVPGTYPVFIVDDRWVVKFFGTHFNGQYAFAVELEVNKLLSTMHDVPSPVLIANGRLLDDGEGCLWPYLVFEFMHASSLTQVRDQLSFDDKAEIAHNIGMITHCLHSVELHDMKILKPTWDYYYALLKRQWTDCTARHRNWHSLPKRLIDQIDEFLKSPEEIIDRYNQPVLLHGDLTADHILVIQDENEWRLKGVIDYGDALVGDPLYELVALHLDLFRCDKRLLREYLLAYGGEGRIRSKKARQLLSLCLLFPFNAFYCFFESNPAASTVLSLDELAEWLWNTEI